MVKFKKRAKGQRRDPELIPMLCGESEGLVYEWGSVDGALDLQSELIGRVEVLFTPNPVASRTRECWAGEVENLAVYTETGWVVPAYRRPWPDNSYAIIQDFALKAFRR